MSSSLLPEQFADLEPFVADWALPTELARRAKRLASSMEQLQAFYDAMLARGEEILRHLDAVDRAGQRDALPAESRRLLYLMFSLCEVSPAVEIFKQPTVIDGFDVNRFVPDHDREEWKRLRGRRPGGSRWS
ncbi:MAG: hypothetical protein AB7V27_14040 [Candidatus Binatia bacterium]